MANPPGWEPIAAPPGWEPATEATAAAPAAPESAVTRLYRQGVERVNPIVSKILNYGLPGAGALDLANAAVRGEQPGESSTAISDEAAKFLVPQTPTQAAVMIGTGGAGRLVSGLGKAGTALANYPKSAAALQALGRITGGVVGNEAGNVIEGNPAGTGTLGTAGTLAAVEAAAPVLGKVMRSLPGAKGRIAADDAAKYGAVMGELSPPLAGARTVGQQRALATGPGKSALGAAKGAANEEIAQGLGAREGLLEIPSLGQTVQRPVAMGSTYPGPQPVTSMQPVTKPMTLQEANDALSAIGDKAFSKNPLDRTFGGVDQRQKYGEVYNDIIAALDKADPTGYSAKQFDKAQAAYKAGLRFLQPLTSDRAVRVAGNEAQFNTPYFQQWASNPKVRASLINKVGQEGADRVLNTLTRGGGQDTRDILGSGAGHLGSALAAWGRGSNTGFWGLPIALGRTLLPNVGSSYAGRVPFSPTAGGMTVADLAALRALGVLPTEGQ